MCHAAAHRYCRPAALAGQGAQRRAIRAAKTGEQQRALIRSSLDIHRRKGMLSSVRQVFRDLGLGEVRIDEGNNNYLADGSMTEDGFCTAGAPDGWMEYRVRIDKNAEHRSGGNGAQHGGVRVGICGVALGQQTERVGHERTVGQARQVVETPRERAHVNSNGGRRQLLDLLHVSHPGFRPGVADAAHRHVAHFID
ncbi:hypothetical protein J9978_14225 [Chromobacterium violaceum]|nr:hypothetical protein [Chromobacterium violaceum]